jgi:cell division protein FtsL
MNAAAKVLQENSVFQGSLQQVLINKDLLLMILLLVAIGVSGFSVIYVKNDERQLYSQLQQLDNERNHLQVEHGQLLLEQSSWASPSRIQQVAERQLNMHYPTARDVVIID